MLKGNVVCISMNYADAFFLGAALEREEIGKISSIRLHLGVAEVSGKPGEGSAGFSCEETGELSRLTVSEGVVYFAARADGRTVGVKAGQTASATARGLSVAEVPPADAGGAPGRTAEEVSSRISFCAACGQANRHGARFCRACGTSLENGP